MTSRGKLGVALCAVLGVLGVATIGAANVNMEIIPAFAPSGHNPFDPPAVSPSWPGYVTNAVAGIEAGGTNVGDRSTDPTAYEVVSGVVAPEELVYTNFNSWRGSASPTGAFASEFGNRIHFGLHITPDPGEPRFQFALDDLQWQLDSDDVTDYFDQAGDFSGANYSSTRVGIDYGPDGVKGGGDDVRYTSGPGTQLIDELVYVGVGDGFSVLDSDTPGDNQADIGDTLGILKSSCPGGCDIVVTAIYTLPNPVTGNRVSGIGTATVFVPEPASAGMVLAGLCLAAVAIRKRK